MVSTAEVSVYLEGISFPALKDELIRYAQHRNAPADVLDALRNLPASEYRTIAGVWHDLGRET